MQTLFYLLKLFVVWDGGGRGRGAVKKRLFPSLQ